jgi:hypothetical protein
MSINRAGTAWRGSPHENLRRNGQRCDATCWCHARSPITGVRNCSDSTPGRMRRDLPYSRQKSIAAAGPAGCGNATMTSLHADIHRLQKRWHGAHCTSRLYAALTRLALQNYLLGLGHNGTHHAILTCLGSRCTVWAKSGGDAQVDPDRMPRSLRPMQRATPHQSLPL